MIVPVRIGVPSFPLVEQVLGKEVMISVPLSLLVQWDHKEVAAGELTQEHARILPAHARVA